MYDVIIVGAGPAGATCARECALRGLKTLLLDKDGFPRSKPCAGAVSEQALSCLDFPLPPSIVERECFGAKIHYHGRTMEVMKKHRLAVLVSRDAFDSFLADKAVEAGANFSSAEKFIDLVIHQDAVDVRTDRSSYKARYVIGADGINSRVALSVRAPMKKAEKVFALVCSVPVDDAVIDSRGKIIDLYFGVAPMGYGWVFPHRGYRSVGIMGLASKFYEPLKAFADFARSVDMRTANTRGHFIPLGGIKRKLYSGRVILVGDAAGFADPFHGEGISHAILSSKLAARAVADILNSHVRASAALARYRRDSERFIRKNLRVALFMARVIAKLPGPFVHIFLDHRGALEKYLNIPMGRLDYKRFWKWFVVHAPLYLLASYLGFSRSNPRRKEIKKADAGH